MVEINVSEMLNSDEEAIQQKRFEPNVSTKIQLEDKVYYKNHHVKLIF